MNIPLLLVSKYYAALTKAHQDEYEEGFYFVLQMS